MQHEVCTLICIQSTATRCAHSKVKQPNPTLGEQFAVYRLASFFAHQLHTAKQTKGFNLVSCAAEQICFGGSAPHLAEIYHLPVWTLLIMDPDVLSKIGGKYHVRGKDIVKIAWMEKISCKKHCENYKCSPVSLLIVRSNQIKCL